MLPYVIGIDIGTGSTKAVAMYNHGGLGATARRHYTPIQSSIGTDEQDVETVWHAFVACIADVVQTMQQQPTLVSLSSCMHSLLAINAAGEPLTPMISWADARSQAVAESLRTWDGAAALYKATGTPLHSMTPLSKIIWFRQHRGDLFSKVAKWISIKEYIWYRLFGTYEVDVSIAAATGMMEIRTFQWHEPALALAGINRDQLSVIVPARHLQKGLQAFAAQQCGLMADVPFCIGSSDGCMANLGSSAMQPGVAALTIGTSGAVRVASSKPVLHFDAMLFNYPIDTGTFICGGPVNNGGNMVHWALRKMMQQPHPTEKDYESFYSLVDSVPAGSNGLVCLPYFIGERAPVWDEKSCGVYLGVKAHHTQAHFLRAALEGVCFALADVLQQVEKSTGVVHQINVSGGFIRSQVWLQMLADITGKKLSITQTDDASAAGAALLGLEAISLISKDYALQFEVAESILPQQNAHATYRQLFSIYRQLYPSLKNTMLQLYQLQQQDYAN